MSSPKIIFKSDKIVDKDFSGQDFLTLLLKNRNLKKEELKEFLEPSDPRNFTAKDFGISQIQLEKAVKRINLAVKNQENILIYGDYDVDGITSTAILWQVLNKKGAKVLPFVPDREKDGYGFKYQSFLNFQKEKNLKFSLLITVDNGIVANKEIKKVTDSDTDVIIVDHHIANKLKPKKCLLVHSTSVSGSVLSWFLASQFDKSADLGLAAFGTVADCMPLVGINRSIVVHGLKHLQKNPNFGIKKLIEISGSKQETLSVYDLGFVLGPRINAVGRISNPTDALRLLCSLNDSLASKYAQSLDGFNKDRQQLQQENIDLAEKLFDKKNKIIFISDPSFHPGIIGLISGRLTEKYSLPSISISVGEIISKGSCRSIPEINIIESLRELSDLFVDLGGHSGAAGFSIETKKIKKLEKEITKIINEKLKNYNQEKSIIVDAQMELSAVTCKNHSILKKIEPFGIGNSEPLFFFEKLVVRQKRLVGNNNHLKLKLGELNIDTIAFKKGDLDSKIKVGDFIDIVARLDVNTWQGVTSPQLIVSDILIA